jgi:hypothetical protein
MAAWSLSTENLATVTNALRAAVEGPFFPEWEFHMLFGAERAEAAELLRRAPDIDLSDKNVFIIVNNALVNLWGYPHHQEQCLADYGLDEAQLKRVLDEIRDGMKVDT